jgi:hypothetical protein
MKKKKKKMFENEKLLCIFFLLHIFRRVCVLLLVLLVALSIFACGLLLLFFGRWVLFGYILHFLVAAPSSMGKQKHGNGGAHQKEFLLM